MPVITTRHYPDGGADYQHTPDGADPTVHSGHLTAAQLAAAVAFVTTQRPNSSDVPWLARIAVACPACGAVSVHPIGGGCAPGRVQRLFLARLKARQANRTWAQALAIARTLLGQEAGEQWALPANVSEEDSGDPSGTGAVLGLSLGGPASGLPGAAGGERASRAPGRQRAGRRSGGAEPAGMSGA